MLFLLLWLSDVLSLWVLDILYTNITFSGWMAMIGMALILAIINTTIKPLLKILSLPITIITLGIFSLVINALMLQLAFFLTPGSSIKGFWTAFGASIVLSIVNSALNKLLGVD